jgi:hypothetical protein
LALPDANKDLGSSAMAAVAKLAFFRKDLLVEFIWKALRNKYKQFSSGKLPVA